MRTLLILVLATVASWAQVKEYKPSRLNFFSKEQDVQLGKESAAEVRKTMAVVKNAELTDYVNRIGQRLAKSPHAGGFPYTFEVINEKEINAFALPGGPMFINSGLLSALDNESQLAGVMAHEMSHVALRHGTANVSKANLIQLPATLGGQILSSQGGILGSLGQMGIGLGAQSVLLKYSRDAESQADLNGAQIMNDVGYDPTQMAVFFQKLEEEGQRDNSLLANFLSDHPTPGNRVKYVSDQNKLLPKKQYTELEPQNLPHIKQVVASLPAPPKPAAPAAAANGRSGGSAPSSDVRPSGRYQAYQGSQFTFSYPDNWEAFGDQNAASVTIAPRSTLVQSQRGNVQVGYGMIVAHYFPDGGKVNLQRDTNALVRQMQAQDPNLRADGTARSVRVAGQSGLLTPLASPSPYSQSAKEVDLLLTIARPDALFYAVFIAPQSEWAAAKPAFDNTLTTLQFAK
jgi:beta-barrel assembly-enhancing protease